MDEHDPPDQLIIAGRQVENVGRVEMVILIGAICALTRVKPAIKAGMKANMVWVEVSDNDDEDEERDT